MPGSSEVANIPTAYSLCSRQSRRSDVDGKEGADQRVWRVEQVLGVAWDAQPRSVRHSSPVGGKTDPTDNTPSFIAIHDDGFYFRHRKDLWEDALSRAGDNSWIVLHTRAPFQHELTSYLSDKHSSRLVLVITADDLRQEGARLSRGLSWERSLEDLVNWYQNPVDKVLVNAAFVLIRHGSEGVALVANENEGRELRLFFDPGHAEGTWDDSRPGQVNGRGQAFTAGLLAALSNEVTDVKSRITAGIQTGVALERTLVTQGYTEVQQSEGPLSGFMLSERDWKNATAGSQFLAAVRIDPSKVVTASKEAPRSFRFLGFVKDAHKTAARLAVCGLRSDPRIPFARFARLVTVDRHEIESLRSIAGLISTYVDQVSVETGPISFAVFGTPGSGKSFCIKQIIRTQRNDAFVPLTFNVAQFGQPADLVGAFHRVRDVGLSGKIPVVFWDEFDSQLNGDSLFWLRYFLAPMEDGVFQDGNRDHHVGRAVFVFAGGTADTMEAFSDKVRSEEARRLKKPDFLSRLRGYLDVSGPNPVGESDDAFTFRRAVLLHEQLRTFCPHLQNDNGEFAIEPRLLECLLDTARYRHGSRSLSAVVRMSSLAASTEFTASALPHEIQLGLHIENLEDVLRHLATPTRNVIE